MINFLQSTGVSAASVPPPLMGHTDDVAALRRTLEGLGGPVVAAGDAIGGSIIDGMRRDDVKALLYVAGLAPMEGGSIADAFCRNDSHPQAPGRHTLVWTPKAAFAAAFAPHAIRDAEF